MSQSQPPIQRIGKRITYAWHEDALTVVIDQKIPKSQQLALEGWMTAWLLVGATFFWSLTHSDGDERMFYSISLAFWTFFAFRVSKVILWRRKGNESIRIHAGSMSVKNAFGTTGRAQLFQTGNLQKMEVIRRESTSFLANLDQSFWIMGGDTIQFTHQNKSFVLGKQLNEKDAHALAKLLDKALRKFD